MAQYIYICPPDAPPHNVDFIGMLSNGSRAERKVIGMPAQSSAWRLDPDQDDTEGVGTILPMKTDGYDLTEIDWSKFRLSLPRFSASKLLDIANAMREVGAKLPEAERLSRLDEYALLSAIYEEVVRLHWPEHQLDESCKECDPTQPPPESEPESIPEPPPVVTKPSRARPPKVAAKPKENKILRALRKH